MIGVYNKNKIQLYQSGGVDLYQRAKECFGNFCPEPRPLDAAPVVVSRPVNPEDSAAGLFEDPQDRIARLQTEAEERERSIQERERSVLQREEEYARQKERDRDFGEAYKHEMELWEKKNSRRQEQLNQKEAVLEEQEKVLNEREKAVDHPGQTILDLQTSLELCRTENKELEYRLAEIKTQKHIDNKELKDKLEQKSIENNELKVKLQQKRRKNKDLYQENQDLKWYVPRYEQLQNQVYSLQGIIESENIFRNKLELLEIKKKKMYGNPIYNKLRNHLLRDYHGDNAEEIAAHYCDKPDVNDITDIEVFLPLIYDLSQLDISLPLILSFIDSSIPLEQKQILIENFHIIKAQSDLKPEILFSFYLVLMTDPETVSLFCSKTDEDELDGFNIIDLIFKKIEELGDALAASPSYSRPTKRARTKQYTKS